MKRTILVMSVLIFTLALVACGGTETATTAGATATTMGTKTEAPDTTETPDTTEAEEPAPSGEVGTRENPIPLGTEVQIGGWTVKVTGLTRDATAAMMEANQFNDEPAAGQEYVLVDLAATYTGEESGTFWLDVGGTLLGSAGNTFDRTGISPSSISDAGETFSGGSIEGDLSFIVDSDQVPGALLILEESWSFDTNRVFMALE
jgi:hypothetical protein